MMSKFNGQAKQLHFAIKMGNIDYIKTIIADGVNLYEVDSDGDTALSAAAKYGDVEVTKCLLSAGVNVNYMDERDETALHKASQKGNVQLVECLVNAGANMRIANKKGDSALDVAAKEGKLEVVEFLLGKGASTYTSCEANNNGDTTLHKAAKWNQVKVVRYLIFSHGMDINSITEKERDTVLHVAAKWGVEEVTKWLLNHGADHTIKNRVGYTPLCCAIKWEEKKVEQYLRNAGVTEDSVPTNYKDTGNHEVTNGSSVNSSVDDPMREAVTKNFQPRLLDLTTLVPIMHNHSLLTAADNDYLMNDLIPSYKRANQLVSSILPSKGPRAFTLFLDCLKKEKEHMGHQELVKMITSA